MPRSLCFLFLQTKGDPRLLAQWTLISLAITDAPVQSSIKFHVRFMQIANRCRSLTDVGLNWFSAVSPPAFLWRTATGTCNRSGTRTTISSEYRQSP